MKIINSLDDLRKLRNDILSKYQPDQREIIVTGGTCGFVSCAGDVVNALNNELKSRGLDKEIKVKVTGCHGFCAIEPAIVINPENILYKEVSEKDIPEIVSETIINKKIIDRLVYIDEFSGKKILQESEIPFYKRQTRHLLKNSARIDPLNIEDYIAVGGYSALEKAFHIGSDKVIAEIKASGLRGRGGAGFPTGAKWETAKKAESKEKFVICNADEGNPGAFMDRNILEGNPHSIIEGMIICGFTIGANLGYIYVRKEYPLAIEHIKTALDQAYQYGFLGENILGTEFSFDIEIVRGAGAFICGEETSLIKSIEGAVVEAQTKPPFPTLKGLWESSTVLNNVKTLASIPLIINNGSDWFSSFGTDTSKGTMVFSMVGKVKNTGLVEVQMGTTLREIIFDICGGVKNGRKFKAVQIGGPSGGCFPESMLDLPVDFESMAKAGIALGSSGMIVLDEDTCMVELARYFMAFNQDESCGKCTPCREGIKHTLDILTRITEGKGQEEDIEILEEMGKLIRELSLCGLGKSAPNPVLSTIKYFRNEYEEHIKNKRCPADFCKCDED